MGFYSKGIGCKHSYRSVIFWGLILSYTTIFLLPNFFAIYTYGKYSANLEKKTVNSLDNGLSQVQDIIDEQIRELNEIPLKMYRNRRLYSILAAQDLTRFTPYDFYEGVSEIYNYKVINSFVENILFYKPKNDFVISTSVATDLETYCNSILSYENFSKAQLEQKWTQEQGTSIWPLETMIGAGNNIKSKRITYVHSLAHDGVNNMDVRLIATINEESFEKLFNKVLDDYEGSIYLTNEEGQIITSLVKGGAEVGRDFLQMVANSDKPYMTTRVNKKGMLVTSVESEYLRWHYIALIPTGQIFNELNSIRNGFIVVMAFLFLGCTFLIIFFANMNYKPVRNVVSMLRSDHGKPLKGRYTNEWKVIQHEVNLALRGKKTLEDYISQQLPVLRSNYILLLMRGSSTNKTANFSMSKSLELEVDKGPFAVMLISIDSYKEIAGVDRDITDEDLLLYKSAVRNVAEELCIENGIGYTTETGAEEVAVLICFDSEDQTANWSAVEKNANVILDTFDRHFHLNLTVGIGKIYPNLSEIKNSFREAQIALEYKIIKGNNMVIKYEDIKVAPDLANYYSMVDEKKILDCLKRGDMEGIRNILNGIMTNLRENPPSLDTARYIYFEIINTALHASNLVGTENFHLLSINTRFQRLFHSDTIDQLYGETLEFYRDICEYISHRKESKNFKLAHQIQEYVDAHYNDSNLSLAMVADCFELSSSYLSRFFKDQFGYTMSEYVQKKRVEAAKELIRSTSKNIVDIAEEMGFGNVHSFIKTFKKYEGLTPGEFRSKIT